MQLRESYAVKASISVMCSFTSHVCRLSKVNISDIISSESSSISGSEYSDFEASMEGEHNERFMNLLVKSGPRDFNRQDEPKTERESQKRITGPRAAAASIKKARLVSAFTLVKYLKISRLLNVGTIK